MRRTARAVLLAGLVFPLGAAGCTRHAGEPAETGRNAPAQPDGPAGRHARGPFGSTFVDATSASGIRFLHVTGARGEKLLPETMGSGAAFLDFDGDARLDVFLVNSSWWPGQEPEGGPRPSCALYRGKGNGTFEDITVAAGAGISLYGMGCAPADHDGDGDDDVFLTGVGENRLLSNDGGVFHDVTLAAGLSARSWKDRAGKEHPVWSTAAAWADVDADSDLDLLVAGYVEWSPSTEIFTTLDGVTKAFTTPDRYRGLPPRLYLSRGDGTFTDATADAGLETLEGKSLGIAAWDFDGNGLLDFVIANDTRPNFLLKNQGGGRFEEVGLAAGIGYDETGRARAGMGIDIEDYGQDGVPGVAIGNFSDEPMSLYRWGKDGAFSPDAARAGLAQPTYKPLAFGLDMEDLDLDGRLDLVVVNGHIEPDVARMFPGQTHAQSAQLFRGRPGGTFEDVSDRVGGDFAVPRVGRGLALGDVDGDGDLDILITVNGGSPVLLRNDRPPASSNHFLRVRLHGKGKNTGAIGATIRLTAGGMIQTRLSRTGSSYLSQSERALTFGLGASTKVDRLEVRWPGGREQVVAVEGVDRAIEIREE